MPRRPFWLLAVPVLLYLLGTAGFIARADRFQSFPLDDAWIHQVYARSFATGHGFEYNVGHQEAGATSPLWVVVTSPVHWFARTNPTLVVAGVAVLGVLLAIAAIILFSRVAQTVTRSGSVAVVAASLLAIEPRLIFSALSGMETMLLLALWLGGLHAILERRLVLATAMFSMMPVTRPESLVILPIFATALILNRHTSLVRRIVLIPILIVPFSAWSLFCHSATGHWLPNTYFIKAHPLQLNLDVIAKGWHTMTAHGFANGIVFALGITLGAAGLAFARQWLMVSMVFVAPVVYMAGVIGTRSLSPDGYYWTRWLDPVSLTLTLLFALSIAVGVTGAARWPFPRRQAPKLWRVISIAIALIAIVLCAPRFAKSFGDRRNHFRTDAAAIKASNIRAGVWLRDHAPAGSTVGVNDAGAIRYFGNRKTIDLLGINNKDLAFSRISVADELVQCDWLAVFPSAFHAYADLIQVEYDVATVIRVPVEQYTICDCPGQATTAIFKKKLVESSP